MKARKVAAQFAAYTWYAENRNGITSGTEATKFAQENWTAFLPAADTGWGRLLLKVATPRPQRARKPKRYRLATAG